MCPDANAWSDANPFSTVRTAPDLVRLASGHILAVGGFDQNANQAVAEAVIYSEESGAWTKIADLPDGRVTQTTTLLANGSVLIAGGFARSTDAETSKCALSQ
jgi:hypothetical protein